MVFLKYISDSFDTLHNKLKEKGEDYEDKDQYLAENIFWVPEKARWKCLQSKSKLTTIGTELDNAMDTIEAENSQLKGILPKVYARPNLSPDSLSGLIDSINNIALGSESAKAKDILGKVYEYFLGQFALAEGKKGGQFYTPKSIVKLLVEMIEPYQGRVFDPCCGTGGMFIMSDKFVREHQGKINDISIYGQESNQTTYRLCRMNLAIRQIEGTQIKWNNEGSFLKNEHPDLKADFILANPPFNDSDWSGDLLQKDGRWLYGKPPVRNANFAWVQHFVYHLSPKGIAGFVLSKGSLTSKSSNEDTIRKNLIEAGLIDCIVNLPAKLFLNTQSPAFWFVSNLSLLTVWLNSAFKSAKKRAFVVPFYLSAFNLTQWQEIHSAKAVGCLVAFLSVDRNIIYFSLMFSNKFVAHNKHSTRATTGVKDSPLVRLYHFYKKFNDRFWGVKLSSLFAFC